MAVATDGFFAFAGGRSTGATALTAEFLDSGRNQVAATFLSSHGFTAGADGRWVRSLEAPGLQWPPWIEAVPAANAPVESRGEVAR